MVVPPASSGEGARSGAHDALLAHQVPVADQQIEYLAQHVSPLLVIAQFQAQTEVNGCKEAPIPAGQAEGDFAVLLDAAIQHLGEAFIPNGRSASARLPSAFAAPFPPALALASRALRRPRPNLLED